MSYLSCKENGIRIPICLKGQPYLYGFKDRELLCELDWKVMLCINMLSELPSFYLTGFCGNSIWKVIPSLSKWKTSTWGHWMNINKSTSCKVMKSQPQRISVFTEGISRSPSCQEYHDMKSSSRGLWLIAQDDWEMLHHIWIFWIFPGQYLLCHMLDVASLLGPLTP